MTENSRNHLSDRPFTDSPCGCRRYHSFTDGHWTDNFGEGPRIFQPGTHYEAWTDNSMCREGHQYD